MWHWCYDVGWGEWISVQAYTTALERKWIPGASGRGGIDMTEAQGEVKPIIEASGREAVACVPWLYNPNSKLSDLEF